MSNISRRTFVETAAGLTGFAFLDRLPALDAAVKEPSRSVADVASDVAPLVRLIEETPREKLMEKAAEEIRKGTSYQELLAAVFLAGVRGIQPRPVGFKFHAVLVINSAHLASLSASNKDRWLPLLWALDYFKSSQARNKAEGDWRMAPPEESKLPGQTEAKRAFLQAMETWNVERADQAITTWGRIGSAGEIFEPFWLLGARDFRDIGHKAIYVANAWRTLQTIGFRHAEPVLRSLSYALLDHEGTNPAKRDDWRDRPGRDNLARLSKKKGIRLSGKKDTNATHDVHVSLRTATAAEASDLVDQMLEKGVHPASIWDGLFLHAGELLMRQPGIIGLHTLTTLNALHFGYMTSAIPQTRAFLLYQAAAFLPLFRQTMQDRGKVAAGKLDELTPLTSDNGGEEILQDISSNRMVAARKTATLLQKSPKQLEPFMAQARRLIFSKGTDSHDYKFSSAVLEDVYSLPSSARPQFMAASVFNLRGSADRDNTLIKRVRNALS